MISNVFYDNIQKYLFLYADLLEQSNSLGLTDKVIHAENLFKNILNLLFASELINANENKKNQHNFDLIDKSRKSCIQVTAN